MATHAASTTDDDDGRVFSFADLALARRLERTEGAANAAFVESRARTGQDASATWIDVAGTWAMFDGVASPLTQTFGLGLFTAPDSAQFERLEQFYATRRCSVHHEVSPLADNTLTAMLGARGYLPIENSTVLHQPLPALAAEGAPGAIAVRAIGAGEAAMWADASALGWSEFEGLETFMRDIGVMLTAAHNVTCFVAELDGVIAATGALVLHDGVALLAGASTVPAYRHRGAQNALLAARLRFARSSGCDLAMITTQPGSPSQRNAERNGFRVAYTRTKWFRA